MALFKYLSEEELRCIKTYKYSSGSRTLMDNILNYFWLAVVQLIPRWFSPNLLSLLGFLCSWAAFLAIVAVAPDLSQEVPPWAAKVVACGIFLYQTFDAVDGLQARRTNSSSPLGTIFDHGCDIVTATVVGITIVGLCSTGLNIHSFLVVAVSAQLSQYLYLWWEYHFRVFFSNPGYGAGVTEAQLLVVACALITAQYGSFVWTANVVELLPNQLSTWCNYLSAGRPIQVNHLIVWLALINNLGNCIYVMVMGLVKVPSASRKRQAGRHILSFLLFLFLEAVFAYHSLVRLELSPILVYLEAIAAYSTVAIRMLLASTCRRPYYTVQWPIFPFCALATLLHSSYIGLLFSHYQTWIDKNALPILLVVLSWQLLYLSGLLYCSIKDICRTLDIRCFANSARRVKAA